MTTGRRAGAEKQKPALEGALETFRRLVRERGLRYTPEREAILRGIVEAGGHFDPEQLHYSLREQGHSVSRASVYRAIPLLMEAGIIEKVEMTDKHAHYELVYGRSHHDHMLCLGCGKAIEFYSQALEAVQQAICLEMGFRGVSHTLEIKGYCRDCGEE